MNAREDWLKARKQGIGGSDIAAILGLSPWKSQVDVWLDKTGRTPDTEMNEAMFWGTVLEDVVASHYADTEQRKVQRINRILHHPQKLWMLANIDRAVVTDGSRARFNDNASRLEGADGILECKTASAYKADEWGRDGDDDAIPTHYAAQAMWYLAVTDLEWCDVAVLIGGQKYLVKRVERDSDTIKGMIERADEFWHKHVVGDVEPQPQSASDALKLYPRDSGISIEANEKTVTLLARARELKQQIAALELELDGDRKKGIQGVMDQVKAWMADASEITLGGQTLATWKNAKNSQKTDWKSLSEELMSGFDNEDKTRVISAHTTNIAGARRFLIK